jgi:hypothetical protein
VPSDIQIGRGLWRIFSVVTAFSFLATAVVSQYLGFIRSDLYADTVHIINQSADLKERIGAPITAGWPRVSLSARRRTGEVRVRLPIRGARGTATVSLRAVNGSGRWEFEQLEAAIDRNGLSVNLLPHPSRTPTKLVLHGSGQLYFVALGQMSHVDVNDLARRYQERYGLSITVLPPLPLAYEGRRQQATRIMGALKEALPELAANPQSVIIAVTDVEMDWFSWRDDERLAVVSTSGLTKTQFEKEVSRCLGLLWFELPTSTDWRSVLYDSVNGKGDIDRMRADF